MNSTTPQRRRPRAMGPRSVGHGHFGSLGRASRSAITWCAATSLPIANTRALWAVWAEPSAESGAIASVPSTCAVRLVKPRCRGSSCTVPSTRGSGATTFMTTAAGWGGGLDGPGHPPHSKPVSRPRPVGRRVCRGRPRAVPCGYQCFPLTHQSAGHPRRRRVGPQPVRRQNHHLPRNRAGKRRFTWRIPPR